MKAVQNMIVRSAMLVAAIAISAQAVVSGDIEMLKVVAERNLANTDAITSWSATAIINRIGCDDPDRSHLVQSVMPFVYSRAVNTLRWIRHTPRSEYFSSGKPLLAVGEGGDRAGLLIDGVLFDYADAKTDDPQAHRLFVVTASQWHPWLSPNDVHPIYSLSESGESWYDRLMFYYNNATDAKQPMNYTVLRAGALVIVEGSSLQGPPAGREYLRYVFDLGQAGNLIELVHQTPEETWHVVVTYETVDGIVLPTSWMRTCDRPIKNIGKATTQPARREWGFEQILWVKNRVNMNVPIEEFTLAKLGVRPLDKFIDPRINQRVEVGPIVNDPHVLAEIVQAVKGRSRSTPPKSATSQPTTSTRPAGKF